MTDSPLDSLFLGTSNRKPFSLPLDAVTRTFAILAIRGAGKTMTAKRLAEEMCRVRLPWICLDPVGVWYGIRATPDGKPGGFQVVVIGGQHADLPIEKTSGQQIAEALIAENVCAVIDLSQESKRFWHTFVTDFSSRLLTLNPSTPRHLFIEEAPEFVPQRTSVDLTARCREMVERLIRLGRNKGYGCTLISQRPATVAKDVLSQCENLIVMRTVGPHDRKALKEWIDFNAADQGLDEVFQDLAKLPTGHGWFWSPQWLNLFEPVKITPSTTFHPGATRQVGKTINSVELCDVQGFVSRLTKQLTKKTIPQMSAGLKGATRVAVKRNERSVDDAIRRPAADDGGALSEGHLLQLDQLRQDLALLKNRAYEAEKKLAVVKKLVEPHYQQLRAVFEAVGSTNGASVDRGVYEPWLEKAGRRGCKRMLEILIERQTLTKVQLGTLASVSYKSSTFRAYMAWLKRNGLIRVEGENVVLQTA